MAYKINLLNCVFHLSPNFTHFSNNFQNWKSSIGKNYFFANYSNKDFFSPFHCKCSLEQKTELSFQGYFLFY